MRISKRIVPLLYTSVAALAGAAIGYAIIQASMLDQKTAGGRISPQALATPPKLQSRLPKDETPNPTTNAETLSGTLPWKSSVKPGYETPETWSTAIQPIAPPERATKQTKPRSPTSRKHRRRKPRQSRALRKRLAQIAPAAKERLAARFAAAKVKWPPDRIAFVAIKDKKMLELHARSEDGPWKFVHHYPVLAASGGAGPKLKQGDKQVPEGLYRIVYLNPKSAYHVSLRVNYPNSFDRRMAAKEKRRKLGGDIMIHGKRSSAGCLAMGDPAVEELFVLAEKTGYTSVRLIITPTDFRRHGLPAAKPGQPKWLPKLYKKIAKAMVEFNAPPTPQPMGLLSFFTQ